MKNYDWFLFDLDNTILDFSSVSRLAFAELMSGFEIEDIKKTYAIYSKINSAYWQRYEKNEINADVLKRGRFEDFFSLMNIDADPDASSKKYFELIIEHSHEIEGALKALDFFKNKGNLAIITNGLSDVQHHRIDKHSLNAQFEHVFISDEMGVSKPNKAFFEHVHHKIGKPNKENVLVIGDNPISDIEGGKTFGFDTLFFNYRKNRNHQVSSNYLVNDWNEIFEENFKF